MWFIKNGDNFLTENRKHGIWWSQWCSATPFRTRAEAETAAFDLALNDKQYFGNLHAVEVNVWMVTTSVGVNGIPSPPFKYGPEWNRLYFGELEKSGWTYGWRNATKYESRELAQRGLLNGVCLIPDFVEIAEVIHIDDVYAREEKILRDSGGTG